MGSKFAVLFAAILIVSLNLAGPSSAQAPGTKVSEPAPAPVWTYRWTGGSEGATQIWRRPATGGEWSRAGQLPEAVLAMTTTAADADLAVARTMKGLYRSTDAGAQWEKMRDLPDWPTAVALSQQTPQLLYLGTLTGGVYLSEDGGRTWEALSDDLGLIPGTFMEVTALAVHPQDDQIIYAATGYWLGTTDAHFSPHGIFLSPDRGQNWRPVHEAQVDGARVTALVPDPDDPLIVGARTESGTQRYRLDTVVLDQQLVAENAAQRNLGHGDNGQG